MIKWRTGLAGFVGSSKHLIKGFFSYQHSVTTEVVAVTRTTFGVFSLIDTSGAGLTSLVDATGTGVTSLITPSLGVLSLIDQSGVGLTSLIDGQGQGVNSPI